ncbi:MAG: DUF4476 domain-containing protein [Syntrophothermus sp.]
MKRILTILYVFLFVSLQAFSQGTTVTVFSAKGEKFILEVNSSRQNSTPEAKVNADNIGGPMVKMKVFMDETGIPPISKSVMNKPHAEFYFVIEKNEKGKYELKSTSHDWSSDVKKEGDGNDKQAVKKDGDDNDKQAVKKEEKEDKDKKEGNGKVTGKAETEKGGKSEAKGNSGETKKGKCDSPISDPDFYTSREAISMAPFDPPRLNNAKNLVKTKCLTSDQVRQVIYVFSGEKTKLDFAKYAYDYVYDPENYDDVHDALRQKSVDELKKYIEMKSK